jgi:hypothetical protein
MATYNEKWFANNHSLDNTRLDVTELSNKEVMIEEINVFFAPRQGKNGWKYNEHPK